MESRHELTVWYDRNSYTPATLIFTRKSETLTPKFRLPETQRTDPQHMVPEKDQIACDDNWYSLAP